MAGRESSVTQSLSPSERRKRNAAKDVLDRAEREIRHLTEVGVDVDALSDRFGAAKTHFADGSWSDAEMTCSEILILAKSMQAITAASLKAGVGPGSKKISEPVKMEISRLVTKEVADRVEAVARTLPTASSLGEAVQTKIEEALVTGGLIERLESVASQKAQSAVAGIPRFTAKDAQAAANLVVQRSLTQFLSSKELTTRVKVAVEAEVTKGLKAAEKRMGKSFEVDLDTKVASIVSPLPTKENVADQVGKALNLFLKEEPFENRVLELASERAKAEVERAPEIMSETASKIAREAASSLFKTYLRSKEFTEQLKSMLNAKASEIAEAIPRLSTEDVEVISRRVGEESLTSLADSEVLHDKMVALGKELVADALGKAGFDKKVRKLAQDVANSTPHITPEELEKKLGSTVAKLEERTKSLEETVGENLAETTKQLDERTKSLEEKLGTGLEETTKQLDERTKSLEEKLGTDLVETTKQLEERMKSLEEKLGTGLAETTKQLDERTKSLEEKLGEGLDEKVASALKRLDELSSGVPTREELEEKIAAVRRDLMTNEDFGEWIKDGALAVMREAGLGEGMADLEEAFVTPEKAEKISRHEALTAAMDMLETKEFTRRIIELFEDEDVRESIPGLGGGGDEMELQIKNVFAEQLESDEFAEKVKELGGGDMQKELVSRVDKIETEALPALVENVLGEKLGAASPEAIDAKISEAIASKLDPAALNKQIIEIARKSISQIANTPEFKEMLDGKFKMVVNYLSQEVVPKQIRRLMGGG